MKNAHTALKLKKKSNGHLGRFDIIQFSVVFFGQRKVFLKKLSKIFENQWQFACFTQWGK